MEICIDFDGTCVTHEFPKVGKDVGAIPVLKKLVDSGHKLILFTMRSDHDDSCNSSSPEYPDIYGGKYLTDAVNWFKQNNIPLFGINSNPNQSTWTKSPKAYGQLYIDDAALGCPLLQDYIDDASSTFNDSIPIGRPYVDWNEVEKLLIRSKVIK